MALRTDYDGHKKIVAPHGISDTEWRTLLSPYLDWTLARTERQSLDVVLLSPDASELVVLVDEAANAWMRLRSQTGDGH